MRALTELEAEITADGQAALARGSRLGLRQRAVLRALAAGPRTARRLSATAGADRGALRRLAGRGLIVTREVERRRRPPTQRAGAINEGVRLSAAQREAVERIAAALETGGSFLLHGVTGSGKTEVYLEAARATLEAGRGVIVLVPEIALTPQTVSRFQRRFGESVALLHSRMPAGARYDEWRRLRSGEARIAVGPRSAVFAPVADLGLIVIDEEHDSSYKQEGDPRYDAREVARRRAEENGAVLVAGTATPRPESWRATPHLQLPDRVDGRPLPPVEIVDMRGTRGALHQSTLAALAEVRDAGAKAIVLINRRGWSTHLACRSCGRAWQCPNCDVSLVLHRGGGLSCHHCGHAEPVPESCPDCSSVTIARVGAGAERIEAELAELLEPLDVFRLDSDSSAGGGHEAAAAALRGLGVGCARGDADGRQGPRLPRGHARRRARRRRHPAAARLPRRGAHLRADHAARRSQRQGRGGRQRDRADALSGRPEHPPRRGPRRRWLPRRGARAPARRCAIRPSRT